ncbi:hypothetical protein PSECIP111951_03450 [Pseudoalteromonas holothuriae]|uniref:CNNM transmembrane domain-containing protein n=1 Tax=Pseudoalteromonas holothuriae TaxID=2963714 RepID=A0A9W4R4Z0_9GAMM|nr:MULTISPECIES: DUF21 domain-containing protein [unclassified Pseudoalteromonas]CAH9065843.1 hypothetical protein PSECIP111951_03450 [Pseudoalteromonas sp. CIP111951]CAH9066296.1 hypothetical protein PSECIP111854_03859 [Pseudoalteromonas sp. CIP111854]
MSTLLAASVDIFIWLGIVVCVLHSAVFSGLNLAFFSMSRLQLEVEFKQGNETAKKILTLREDANFLLATILWGNVSINVLLTLLSDSILAGAYSFVFSAVVITFLGEIFPQAYFSRNALKMASMLTPVIRFYQKVLYLVARPTAILLDGWLGKEGITYFREEELKAIITAHAEANEADLVQVEGVGALNFLEIDKISVMEEGEVLDPKSVVALPCKLDLPIIPDSQSTEGKAFINSVNVSGHKWAVLTNQKGVPQLVLDVDGYLRTFINETSTNIDPYSFCHRPVIIKDEACTLGEALSMLKHASKLEESSTDVLNHDLVLVWTTSEQRVITGADVLGRLLKGIGNFE